MRLDRVAALLLLFGAAAGCDCDGGAEREATPAGGERATSGGAEVDDGSRGPAIAMRPTGPGVPEPSRFEAIDPALASRSIRARGWASIADLRSGSTDRLSLGNWLCRIWTLYGPPPETHREGFVYAFRDRETGDVITAYSAGSGPAMGGTILGDDGLPLEGAQQRVAASVDAFVALMEATAPSDCELEVETDFGQTRVGVRGGEWFEESVE